MKRTLPRYFFYIIDFIDNYRLLTSFIFTSFTIVLLNIFAFQYVPPLIEYFINTYQENREKIPIDFAPEVWLGLLTLVLGTLIIVVSIASQNTPKLIDLYMQDWISLYYVWFISLTWLHNVFLQLYMGGLTFDNTSAVLNTYFFLPLAGIFAIPYIFYVFYYTKPQNVIEKIHLDNIRRIHSLRHPLRRVVMDTPKIVEEYQYKLFETLNQFDDLLEYLPFKEPKGEIISKISTAIREYVPLKNFMNPNFFKMSDRIRSDISFKTMIGQFDDIEQTKTFFEQKSFRLLGNAYLRFIKSNMFDLASLCVSELTKIGQTAIEESDDDLIDLAIIHFNTTLRLGINQLLNNNELKNIFNAIFHYGEFVSHLIRYQKEKYVSQCCRYLNIYSSEIYSHSRNVPSFMFLVEVFAAEMKAILTHLCEDNWPLDFQKNMLELLLLMDHPFNLDQKELDQGHIVIGEIRVAMDHPLDLEKGESDRTHL